MNPMERFLEYAAAFERSYTDDDWSRLDAFFDEDAVYTVSGGAPLGGRWEGREAVIAHLRESVEALDRRFDERRVEPVGSPEIGADRIQFAWRGSYRREGEPELVFGGTECATFAGDRIRLLEDEMEPGSDLRIQAWLAEHDR